MKLRQRKNLLRKFLEYRQEWIMPKMSFKCKECGKKIIVKEPGMSRCDECGSIYKCFFEVKKKSSKEVVPHQVDKPEKKEESIMKFYGGHQSA